MPQLSFESIVEARERVKRFATRTPVRQWEYLRRTLKLEAPTFLKLETFQNTGAFKVRGASNKILSLIEGPQKPGHIVAASAGNHAQAVAFVAGRLGIPATIFMPEGAPLVKAAATADYGARVIQYGNLYDDAFQKAQEFLRDNPDAVYVHAYEDPVIIAGQGTLGLEIHEQLLEQGVHDDDIQVIVPIGGGGLISGVATALKKLRPRCRIIGVVSQAAPAMAESFVAGHVIESKGRTRTLAEGLAVKKVSQMTFALIKELVSEIHIATDDEIAVAISTLMERGKLVVEGSGAAGVAVALSGKVKLDPKKPSVFVLCGGNIDMNTVSNILERALTAKGRWVSIEVTCEDKPGVLAQLAATIGGLKANILQVDHDRTGTHCPLGYNIIRFELETRGLDHVKEIKHALEEQGQRVEVLGR
jgi:threonine dehydratase